jgi:hypothetical protein
MAVNLAPRAISPSAAHVGARPSAAPPEDLAGARFLASVPWALLAAGWGAWLGAMVESAVESSPESRIGALIAAPLLALCGAALAFLARSRHGIGESIGRALMDATTFTWQGAWLGALISGGFAAAGGGAWVIAAALGAVALGGLVGLGVGLRLFRKDIGKILNGAIWGGVIGGFAASFLWSSPAAAAAPSAPDPVASSPAFGPAADWIWRTAGAAPLVLAVFVWWLRWMREERHKEKDAVSWGMGIAALLFTGAMAAGVGAIVGGLAQLGIGYVAYHVNLTPTPGAWIGALVALFFWGLKQQPKRTAEAKSSIS